MNLDAVISGAGQSAVGRRLDARSARPHRRRRPRRARRRRPHHRRRRRHRHLSRAASISRPGFAGGIGVAEVQDALRLELDWYAGGIESPGQLGAIVQAALAVHAGLARHVVCFRTVCEASAQGTQGRSAVMSRGEVGGFMQWLAPFGAPSAAVYVAMLAARHFHEYGTTREQLAQIALNVPRQRRAEPGRGLPRPTDARRLPRGAHDLASRSACSTATSPPTAAPRSSCRAPTPSPICAKPPIRFEAIGTALARPRRAGPVGGPHHHGLPRRRRDALATHRPHARRRRRRGALRRLLVHGARVARGARLLRHRRGRAVRRGRRAHRARRRAAAQHRRRPAVGRTAPRVRPRARGGAPALGRGRRAAGGRRARGRGRGQRRTERRLPVAHARSSARGCPA